MRLGLFFGFVQFGEILSNSRPQLVHEVVAFFTEVVKKFVAVLLEPGLKFLKRLGLNRRPYDRQNFGLRGTGKNAKMVRIADLSQRELRSTLESLSVDELNKLNEQVNR